MEMDLAQLVSVALFSPKPEESVAFFHDMLGMELSHTEGQSVYLRAYEDFYQYTLKITEAAQPGLEEVFEFLYLPAVLALLRQVTRRGAGDSAKRPDLDQSPEPIQRQTRIRADQNIPAGQRTFFDAGASLIHCGDL